MKSSRANTGEVSQIVAEAKDFARGRNEPMSTGHMLVVLALRASTASAILHARRVTADLLQRSLGSAIDDDPRATEQALERAHELCTRRGSPHSSARSEHLLYALAHESKTAAFRMLAQSGCEVTKLRVSALQTAMGLMPAPRGASRESGVWVTKQSNVLPRTITAPPAAPAPTNRPTPAQMPPPRETVARPVASAPFQDANKSRTPAKSKKKRYTLSGKEFPILTKFGRNLTEAALNGELDPVVGREPEMDRALDVLGKRTSNCPCLVGRSGVGKTSVAHGLATRLAGELEPRIVVELSPATLLANTAMRGQLAEKLAELSKELCRAKGRVIVFFDDIHLLFSPEAGEEGTQELKRLLSRGELFCIGATTPEEFARTIDKEPMLSRRVVPIAIKEFDREEAFLAIAKHVQTLESHHEARLAHETVAHTIAWTSRYLPERAQPDKALQMLDLAGSRARRQGLTEITPDLVAEAIAETAQVPIERLLESDRERMLRFEELIQKRVVGHADAVKRIGDVMRRNASGIGGKRPIGVFLLLGPTGVGKTETAKAVAECLFGAEEAMTRIDMSEYAESHSIAKLIGAPPGYVGHDAGGQLTEAVRKRPYQVILLDEIEKAHRDVLEGFLQVFDDGRLTDGRGRTVDFTNTVIFLTSNLGANVATSTATASIGFSSRRVDANKREESRVIEAARKELPPELFNRFDETLVFGALTKEAVSLVARRMLESLATTLQQSRGIELEVSDEVIDLMLEKGGYEPSLGARPMRRTIARLVEARIADLVLRRTADRGDVLLVYVEGGEIVLDIVRQSSRNLSAAS